MTPDPIQPSRCPACGGETPWPLQPALTGDTPAGRALALLQSNGVLVLPDLWDRLLKIVRGRPGLSPVYVAGRYLYELTDRIEGGRVAP